MGSSRDTRLLSQYLGEQWSLFRHKYPVRQSLMANLSLNAVLFTYAIVHCQFYVSYVAQAQSPLADSLLWAIAKFGIWLVLTPLLFRAYSKTAGQPLHQLLIFFTAVCGATVASVAVASVYHLQPNLQASLVTFIPTQLATGVLVALVWFAAIRPAGGQDESAVGATNSLASGDTGDTGGASIALQVSTGTQECTVESAQIELISAAGNYVEVSTGAKMFILRATMKELEQKLEPYGFVRVHRSYLVHKKAIVGRVGQRALRLKNGAQIALSHRYRSNLEVLKDKPSCSANVDVTRSVSL